MLKSRNMKHLSSKEELIKELRLDDIRVNRLKRIPAHGGDVIHALKESETDFVGFGEVYFSWIKYGAIKAWKCHQRMTLNFVVPLGAVQFVFHLPYPKETYRVEKIGEARYVRLTVPPGIWFGFKGIASGSSILMNLASIEHDDNEVLRKPLTGIKYNWANL